MGVCVITRHGEQRIRERVGLPKKAVKRCAMRAMTNGLSYNEANGELLKYLNRLSKDSHGGWCDNIKVYGDKVYLFYGLILVTVLTIPTKHRKQAIRQQRRKREGMNG